MVGHSRANLHLNESVVEISKEENGTFILRSCRRKSAETESRRAFQPRSGLYDTVIISTPFQFSDIRLSPASIALPERIEYVGLRVTLFTSPHKLSPGYFGLSRGSPLPEVILTTLPNGNSSPPPFFSISTLQKVTNPVSKQEEYAYKIFSSTALEVQFLSRLLGFRTSTNTVLENISTSDISWIHTKTWDSYPYLSPRTSFDGPQLEDDLYYTSGIESFISTMETSSLMGMNVARLILDAEVKQPGRDKAELEL